jgi:hypothetical protein
VQMPSSRATLDGWVLKIGELLIPMLEPPDAHSQIQVLALNLASRDVLSIRIAT